MRVKLNRLNCIIQITKIVKFVINCLFNLDKLSEVTPLIFKLFSHEKGDFRVRDVKQIFKNHKTSHALPMYRNTRGILIEQTRSSLQATS